MYFNFHFQMIPVFIVHFQVISMSNFSFFAIIDLLCGSHFQFSRKHFQNWKLNVFQELKKWKIEKSELTKNEELKMKNWEIEELKNWKIENWKIRWVAGLAGLLGLAVLPGLGWASQAWSSLAETDAVLACAELCRAVPASPRLVWLGSARQPAGLLG